MSIKGYIETLKGLLATRDACKHDFGGLPDYLKKKSPQFRMFLDSDLTSSISIAIKKQWSDAIINSVRSHFPKSEKMNKFATGLGNWIGEKANSFMDRVKLTHHYYTGRISIDQYLDRRSEQIQATFINIADKCKKNSWIIRAAIYSHLEQWGVPNAETLVGNILKVTGIRALTKKVTSVVDKVVKSQKTKDFIQAGIATVHEGVNLVTKAYNTVKEKVVQPVVKTIAKAIERPAEIIVDCAVKGYQAAKRGIQKGWNWLKEKAKRFF